jgi:glycosyltransferase involved in cell wall biosynthesis
LKVSILIPVRNGEQFLTECMDSILYQTYTDWEVIIVNDHSTDSTLAMLEQYAVQDSRIKVENNRGKGIIPALQLAYSKSSGDFVTRMDADDRMSSHKIELMVSKLQEKGEGFVAVGLVEYFSEEGIGEGYFYYQEWLNRLTLSEINFNEIYKECVIPSPSWMMHTTDFEKMGGFDAELYPEDYELAFRMLKYEMKIASIPEIIHFWRDYQTRTSRTDSNYSDNFFLPLKMNYFFEIHRDEKRPIQLWGAGKKGKELATYLVDQQIEFNWATNNKNKIGKEIYGIILQSDEDISFQSNPQILVAIRNRKAADEIKKALKSKNLKPNVDFFFMS